VTKTVFLVMTTSKSDDSVIVISRFLKRYLKAKRTKAPAYSRALYQIRGVVNTLATLNTNRAGR